MLMRLPETQTDIEIDQVRLAVISDAAPSRNGVGAYYQDLIEQLDKRLEAISLFCPTIVDNKWQAGLALPLPGDSTQKLCLPNYWRLKRELGEFRPDVIIIATPGPYGLCGAHLAVHLGIPFLTGFHTSFEHLTALYWPNSLRGKVVEKYFLLCNRYLFKRTSTVLGNSSSILEQAHAMGAQETQLIGTPLAADFLLPDIIPGSGEFQRILFAGRLAREKNLEALFQAAENLPALSFSIAGDGPLRDEVIRKAGSLANLHYLGWLNRGQLRETIDRHDALVLPSHYETFGTIALEAMARQRLVVVSSGCGISHWSALQPGLFVYGENETLQDSLASISRMTPEIREKQANLGYQAAMELNRGVVDSWCFLLEQVLLGHSGR